MENSTLNPHMIKWNSYSQQLYGQQLQTSIADGIDHDLSTEIIKLTPVFTTPKVDRLLHHTKHRSPMLL
jgi:hypothetical protein